MKRIDDTEQRIIKRAEDTEQRMMKRVEDTEEKITTKEENPLNQLKLRLKLRIIAGMLPGGRRI